MKNSLEKKFITLKERELLKQKIYNLILLEVPVATAKFANILLDEVKEKLLTDALNQEILAYKSIEQEEGFNYE